MLRSTYFLWLMAGLLTFSCSVQKRHYTRGYHLAWHKTNPDAKKTTSGKTSKQVNPTVTAAQPTEEVAVTRTSTPIQVKTEETVPPVKNDNNAEAAAKPGSNPKPLLFKDWQVQKEQIIKKNGPEPDKKKSGGNNSPDETTAIIALVFSILGLTLLPLIGSIIGLVLANSALRKAQADPSKYGGEDLARIARIVSIVGLILALLFIVFFLLIFVLILSIL